MLMIIPAIDIKGGCVVRLVQGRRDEKVYSRFPLKTAKHWVRQGAQLLHIVDLDGASSGTPKNLAVIKEIVKDTPVRVELGGGIRSLETMRALLNLGLYRLVLGTKALQDEGFLKKAFKEFKQKIIVSIDARLDSILIKGWKENLKSNSLEAFALKLKEIGFKEFIYTDTLKDGTLKGPNIKSIKKILKKIKLRMIASGGVSSLEDIRKLKLLERQGLTGVIIGKALYEGNFTLPQALRVA